MHGLISTLRRWWRLNIRAGRRREMGLGPVSVVSLADARDKALTAKNAYSAHDAAMIRMNARSRL